MKRINGKKGFTIIEVVLVLAIAGLIFLVVFLALPALQRGQRDTQRKSDLSRFMSQITNYSTNNQGQLPGGATPSTAAYTDFVTNYLRNNSQQFSDPQGGDYGVTYVATASTTNIPDAAGEIFVYGSSRCNGSVPTATGAGSRSIAALIYVEQGGTYCQNN